MTRFEDLRESATKAARRVALRDDGKITIRYVPASQGGPEDYMPNSGFTREVKYIEDGLIVASQASGFSTSYVMEAPGFRGEDRPEIVRWGIHGPDVIGRLAGFGHVENECRASSCWNSVENSAEGGGRHCCSKYCKVTYEKRQAEAREAERAEMEERRPEVPRSERPECDGPPY